MIGLMVEAGIASWNTAGLSSASGRYCTGYGRRGSQDLSRPGPSTSWRAQGESAPASASIRPLATSITADRRHPHHRALEQRLAERLLLVGLAMQAEGAADAAWRPV